MSDSSENVIKSWISASLVRKVGAGLVFIAILLLLAISGAFLQVQQWKTNAEVTNIAGRQRMFSQLIANRIQQAVSGEVQAGAELKGVAELFDQSLQGLQNGDAELGLPPAPASVQSGLDSVNELWVPTFQNVQIVLEMISAGGQVRTLALNLSKESETLLAATDAVLIALREDNAPISTISFAQRLPISAERIAELALKIDQGQIGVAPQLTEEVERFDEVLSVLLVGDAEAPGVEQLLAIKAVWEPFYADARVLLAASEKGLQANQAVVASSEPLLQATDRVVTLFEQETRDKVEWLQQFLAGVTGIFLLVFGAVLWATRGAILPLTDMSRVAVRIAEGDLSAEVAVNSRDEIGQLARAFNSMMVKLQELYTTLERRVAARTQRLEIVATLSERLSAILRLEDLLVEVVDQIKDHFGYYHAHIYLLDDKQEKLVVAEGTGEAGAVLKASGHSINLDAPTSLVARAARSREIVSAPNVRDTEDWLPNPLLPDTYSEMAVPIMVEGQVVGVLDVQEDEIAGLDEGDANLLRSLAGQVAVAIRNARLFAEVENALADVRLAQERYVQQMWRATGDARQQSEHHYRRPGTPLLDETLIAELEREALAQSRPAIVPLNGGDSAQDPAALVAPIRLHEQAIGVIQLHETEEHHQWSRQEMALVQAVTEEVAQAAETLRLFDETRKRATRENVIREITAKMRLATNLEELVKVTAEELGQRFSIDYALVELGLDASAENSAQDSNGHK